MHKGEWNLYEKDPKSPAVVPLRRAASPSLFKSGPVAKVPADLKSSGKQGHRAGSRVKSQHLTFSLSSENAARLQK